MKTRKAIACIIVVLLAMTAITSCSSGGGSGGGAAEEQSVQLAISRFPATLDPHELSAVDQYAVYFNIYDPLVYVTDDGEEVLQLAESYDLSPDGKEYTFHLREGVKFHNGETLTADDVVYSLERAAASPYMETYLSTMDKAEKVDDLTVKVILTDPTPAFMRNEKYVPIVNKKFTEESGDLAHVACGTGPYYLADYSDGISITLKAFDDYWEGAPQIKTATFNYIADDATRTLGFESGDLDFITVPGADWDRISGDGSYKTGELVVDVVYWLVMNTEKEPFNDVRVRQAVACAVNKEDILTMAANGNGIVANVLANPAIIDGATGDVGYFTYDPEKAKQLLAEAGYPDGVDLGTFTFAGGTVYEKIAIAAIDDLSEVGMTVATRSLDSSAASAARREGDFTLAVSASALGRDYSFYSQFFTTPFINVLNFARVSDPELDAAFADAVTTVDKDEREAKYKALIGKLEEACYIIPIYYENMQWASVPNFVPCIDDSGVWLLRSYFE